MADANQVDRAMETSVDAWPVRESRGPTFQLKNAC
jgi:hypothetical protein